MKDMTTKEKDAMMKTVQNCQKIIKETNSELKELQSKLIKHMGKRPKKIFVLFLKF